MQAMQHSKIESETTGYFIGSPEEKDRKNALFRGLM
jgi:hypothetical protein